MEMTRKEKAIQLFLSGANCAQAVVAAFADLIGMDEKTALRLAAPFGGGLARQREVCGAVSGMCMVAGALYGYDDLTDDAVKAAHYRLIRSLCDAFKEAHGTLICRELLGSKKGKDTAPDPDPRTEEYYRTRPCARQVGTAAGILEAYVQEHSVK
ncbi:MAG: C_GCAxxG_C_C family protein [Clostridia bacterium]|nr:C_GCAxxG_C_C family protein [Clostridia bacterium]